MKILKIILIILIIIIIFKNKEKFTVHNTKLNIYGEPLQICKSQNDESDRDGSFEDGGYCTELGGGVHQLCFKIKEESQDFAKNTRQSYNWSADRLCKKRDKNGNCIEKLESNNHCMCLGAYSLYKNRQINNPIYDEITTKTSNELICEAIPETVFNEEYINSWNTWNTNEIPNQIKVGVEEMVKQCSQNISSEQKQILINKYCNLASKKSEMKEGKFYKKHCIERMSNMISLDFINSKELDAKIKELLDINNNDLSFDNMLKETQKWCANMRFSASIITAAVPLKDQINQNELFFPVSVCCSSDYCEMKDETNFPKFSYELNNGIYYLIKETAVGKKIVQILEKFNTENEAKLHIDNNQNIYFPYISQERINELCSL